MLILCEVCRQDIAAFGQIGENFRQDSRPNIRTLLPMKQRTDIQVLVVVSLLLQACATASPRDIAATCDLASSAPGVGSLNSNEIRVLNWNVQKTADENWQRDFARFSADANLVLLQEAVHGLHAVHNSDSDRHISFAAGYGRGDRQSGVMTLSDVAPLAECRMAVVEPLLRTPKAIGVTRFALTGSRDTLLVINVHAVNFSPGLGAYRRQFLAVAAIIDAHDGPVIVAGDLNTWRNGRVRAVDEVLVSRGLAPVEFGDDRRVEAFGQPLDHIYMRGLRTVDANTRFSDTSDHNPLFATFKL